MIEFVLAIIGALCLLGAIATLGGFLLAMRDATPVRLPTVIVHVPATRKEIRRARQRRRELGKSLSNRMRN